MQLRDEDQTVYDNVKECHISEGPLIKREMCAGDLTYAVIESKR